MFIMLSGVSGSGKNTIISELLKINPNLRYLKSCTNRKIRPEERGDEKYIYLSEKEFNQKIDTNQLFEYEEVHGNYYGTLRESIGEIVEEKYDYIKDMGVLGQKYFNTKLKNKVKTLSIFLDVPRDELRKRLELRGEKDIDKRLERMEFEVSHRPNFDLIIPNDDLGKTVQIIDALIKKYRENR